MSKGGLLSQRSLSKAPGQRGGACLRVARSWIYALLDRYRAEGEAAFEPPSRRPKTSPNAISDHTADLIITLRKELAGQGLDAGPQTICWRRPALPHRRRPDPRPNPRPAARPGPRRPHHRRRHRRTPPPAHSGSHPQLPAHRPATRAPARNTPPTEKPRTLTWVRGHS